MVHGLTVPVRSTRFNMQVYFDDGDSVELGDNDEALRRQLDRLEDGGFDKFKAYLDIAQLNLEVKRTGCFECSTVSRQRVRRTLAGNTRGQKETRVSTADGWNMESKQQQQGRAAMECDTCMRSRLSKLWHEKTSQTLT